MALSYQDYLDSLAGDRWNTSDAGTVDTAVSQADWNRLTDAQRQSMFGTAGGVLGGSGNGYMAGENSGLFQRNQFQGNRGPLSVSQGKPTTGVLDPSQLRQDEQTGMWVTPYSNFNPEWMQQQERAGGFFTGKNPLQNILRGVGVVTGIGGISNLAQFGSVFGEGAGAAANAAGGAATPAGSSPFSGGVGGLGGAVEGSEMVGNAIGNGTLGGTAALESAGLGGAGAAGAGALPGAATTPWYQGLLDRGMAAVTNNPLGAASTLMQGAGLVGGLLGGGRGGGSSGGSTFRPTGGLLGGGGQQAGAFKPNAVMAAQLQRLYGRNINGPV